MRWLALAVLGACSFSPGAYSAIDGSAADPDAPNDQTMANDASPDVTPPAPGKVRSIDITDAKVIGGPHTDFPLLVSLTDAWLKSTANAGDVARDDGADLYFSADQAGTTRHPFEIESYDPVAGTLLAWVRVPLAATTVLYVHYGDPAITTTQAAPTMVWSAGFELVAHLNGGGDSTAKNVLSGALVPATGPIGNARSFDGTTSVISTPASTAIADVFTGGGAVETWFYADTLGGGGLGRLFEKGAYIVFIDDSNPFASSAVSFFHQHTGGDTEAFWHFNGITNLTGAWHHFAMVYNKDSASNDPVAFIDGVQVDATRAAETAANTMTSDAASPLYIGNRSNLDRGFDGILDEIRLSSVPRSAGWYATQFRNQSNPADFYTVSAPL